MNFMLKHLYLIIFFVEKMKSKNFVVSAHQPNFIPYLGFFDKIQKSDIVVIRDEVQYVTKEFHNRNKIRINSHNQNILLSKWLNVPVNNSLDYIKNININKDSLHKNKSWNKNILQNIKINYHKTPFFDEFFPEIGKIMDNSDDKLISLNMKLIKFLMKSFNIQTKIIMASDLKLKQNNIQKSNASEDISNICKVLDANTYLSGGGAKIYLNEAPFINSEIKVEFQEFDHPIYSQAFPGFLPNMSALDALFCCGKMPLLEKPLEITN